jgi:hypothetical protein
MSVKAVHTCHDAKCTLGITGCIGCKGFGRVNPKGKTYRREENIPAWAVDHADCNGTGLVACTERTAREPLSVEERKTLGLPPVERKRKNAAVAA